MNANTFADKLDDPRIEEKLQNILKSLLVTVSKEITKLLEDKLSELSVLVKRLQSDLALRDSCFDELTAENRKLRNDLQTAATEVRNLEQCSRRDNLVIFGLPATFAETAAATDESSSDKPKAQLYRKFWIFATQVLAYNYPWMIYFLRIA